MIWDIILSASFAWAIYWLTRDALATARGVNSGIAVEGNGLIVWLAGSRPTLLQFLAIEMPIRIAIFVPGFFHPSDYPHAITVFSVTCLIGYGWRNITGVQAWKKLGF